MVKVQFEITIKTDAEIFNDVFWDHDEIYMYGHEIVVNIPIDENRVYLEKECSKYGILFTSDALFKCVRRGSKAFISIIRR